MEKIINDPVFGFIRVPGGPLLDVVSHPAFHRLSRINQLGLATMVYPGAQHTRLQHSLGAFHLMTLAIESLRRKGCFIFDSEAEAVQLAILMHDIGHGPFSHVLEHTLFNGVDHEEISLMIMEKMNQDLHGALTLAIQVFRGQYEKKFLHRLISSQLDMDRLDYLRRDSFYTGVAEGNIGSLRIIDMLNVVDDHLVVEKKGIYPIENFLVGRRLMYWQVYFHKTAVAAEHVLKNALNRAMQLARSGEDLFASPSLRFFLYNSVGREQFFNDPECLEHFLQLDDNDVWTSLKVWCNHPDRILSILSRDFIHRNIFRVEVSETPFSQEVIDAKKAEISRELDITTDEAEHFIALLEVGKDMYTLDDDKIEILLNNGETRDVIEISDMLNISVLQKKVKKYYFAYQRFLNS